MAEHRATSKCAVSLLCLTPAAQPVICCKVYCFSYVKPVRKPGMIGLGECYEECSWPVFHLKYRNVMRGEQGRRYLGGHVVQLIRAL